MLCSSIALRQNRPYSYSSSDSHYCRFSSRRNDNITVVGLADSSGNVVQKMVYSAWGQPSYETSNGNLAKGSVFEFGYTGMFVEPGMLHTHFRDYDWRTHRWDREDPAGYQDGLNLYGAYFDVNGSDPLGLNISDNESNLLDKYRDSYSSLMDQAISSAQKGDLEGAEHYYNSGLAKLEEMAGMYTRLNKGTWGEWWNETGNHTEKWANIIGKLSGTDDYSYLARSQVAIDAAMVNAGGDAYFGTEHSEDGLKHLTSPENISEFVVLGRLKLPGAVIGKLFSSGGGQVLRPLSRFARSALQKPLEKVGAMSLPYRVPLTASVEASRFFATATKSYVRIRDTYVGKVLQNVPGLRNVRWEQGHTFIQNRWFRSGGPTQWYPSNKLANIGLMRIGNAGWNLTPMPRAMNFYLGQHPWMSFGYGAGVIGGSGTAIYGSYKLGNYIVE